MPRAVFLDVVAQPAGSPGFVFAATGVAFLFTMAWLVVQLGSAVRFARAPSGEVDRLALVAWGLSFVGGFTGPCVILLSLVALGVGAVALRRAEPGSRARIAGQAAVVASVVIVVMAVLMVAILAVGGVFSR